MNCLRISAAIVRALLARLKSAYATHNVIKAKGINGQSNRLRAGCIDLTGSGGVSFLFFLFSCGFCDCPGSSIRRIRRMLTAGISGNIDLTFTVQLKQAANNNVPVVHRNSNAESASRRLTVSFIAKTSRPVPTAAKMPS